MLSIYKSKSKKLKLLTRNLYTGIYGSLCFFPQSPETGNNGALQAEKDERTVVHPHSELVLSDKKSPELTHKTVRTNLEYILPSGRRHL